MDKIYACLLTILIEAIVITFYYYKLPNKKFWVLLQASIPLNMVTNVSLNLILEGFYSLIIWQYLIILLLLEVVVVVVEAVIIYLIIKENTLAIKISIIMNVTSFVIGSLILNLLISSSN